jgi:hypothetical protein
MAELHDVFNELVREHGLTASTDLAIAMALARVMVDPDVGDPLRADETIGRLKMLLPAAGKAGDAETGGPAGDLSVLSDEELSLLDAIYRKIQSYKDPNKWPTRQRVDPLLKLSGLRKANAVLREANTYLQSEVTDAERKGYRRRGVNYVNSQALPTGEGYVPTPQPIDGTRAPGVPGGPPAQGQRVNANVVLLPDGSDNVVPFQGGAVSAPRGEDRFSFGGSG